MVVAVVGVLLAVVLGVLLVEALLVEALLVGVLLVGALLATVVEEAGASLTSLEMGS